MQNTKSSKRGKHNPFYGSILLIAGSTIGAGMLALPVVVGQLGFWPAMLLYVGVWLFMLVSGLMLFEALSWNTLFSPTQRVADLQISSQAQLLNSVKNTLGPIWKTSVICTFMALFTSLMIAYLDKGGALLWMSCIVVLQKFTITQHFALHYQECYVLGSILLTCVTCYVLTHRYTFIDKANRIGMVMLVASFVFMIWICIPSIETENLRHVQFHGAAYCVPFLITSFGFHNMLPSVATYTGGYSKRTVLSIIIGSSIPLIVYALWTFCVLGVIPIDGELGLKATFDAGHVATDVLSQVIQNQSKNHFLGFGYNVLGGCAQIFAFAAIITSVFGQGMSISGFAKECMPRVSEKLIIIVFFSFCLLMTWLCPNMFMASLEYAGGIFAIFLFVLTPGMMLIVGRRKNYSGTFRIPISNMIIVLIMVTGMMILMLEILKVCKIHIPI